MEKKTKNTSPSFLLQSSSKKTSWKTTGKDEKYLSDFSITGQLEVDFLEDHWIRRPRIPLRVFYYRRVGSRLLGSPVDKKTKNASPSSRLQGSWKKSF